MRLFCSLLHPYFPDPKCLPWLHVFPVYPGKHLHLLGPTHSPCLQPCSHWAGKIFNKKKKPHRACQWFENDELKANRTFLSCRQGFKIRTLLFLCFIQVWKIALITSTAGRCSVWQYIHIEPLTILNMLSWNLQHIKWIIYLKGLTHFYMYPEPVSPSHCPLLFFFQP